MIARDPGAPVPIERVTDQVVRIPVPLTFFSIPINVYLLLGREPILVDTGPATEEAHATLAAGLALAGVRAGDIRHIVVTHGHADHHGLAGRLQAESGARVHAHENDAEVVSDWEAVAERRRPEMVAMARFWGFADAAVGFMERHYAKFGRFVRSARGGVAAVRGDEPVPLVLGDVTLRAIPAPGHTEGLICLFHEASGLFFSTDHVLEEITPNPTVYTPEFRGERTGLGHYLRSLDMLRGLGGVERVLPGHGAPFRDLRGRIEEIFAHHAARKADILRALEGGARTVIEVAARVWKDLPPDQLYLAAREVHGHLDLLIHEGAARRETTPEGVGLHAPA